jgi:membrane fusion protein, heavy metal efflux system
MPVDVDPDSRDGDAAPDLGTHCASDHRPGRAPTRPTTLVAFILVAAILAAAGYLLLRSPIDSQEAVLPIAAKIPILVRDGDRVTVPEGSPLRSSLALAPVAEQDIARSLALPAVVEADPARLIKVLPPLAGRVTQLKVQLGEQVEAGQPLAVIDSPDLAAAYADYDRAKVLLSLATRNRDRQSALVKIGGAADKDLQQGEADYATAEAEQRRAEARLKQIGVDADTTSKARTVTVTAPMAGSVIDLAVGPGAFWNDATAALMTIADLRTVWVTAGVPEKDTSLVARGQTVDVVFAAYRSEPFKGTVLFVSDVLDPDTRRTKVRIAFANSDGRLKPGMFATVSFHASARRAAVVPTSALLVRDDANAVLVEVAPWTFVPRKIEIAFQQGDQAVLLSGVTAADRIVIKGGVLLGD